MYKLKYMKDKLIDAIETQIEGNLEAVNATELGEVVDMVKDISEAIYYCTVTEAMEGKDYNKGNHYPASHYYEDGSLRYYGGGRRMDERYPAPYYEDPYPIMYNSGNSNGSRGGGMTPRYYEETNPRYIYRDHEYPTPDRMNMVERSTNSRRRYMDGKMHNDKSLQMKELETYTQELASDITEMIRDASPEEKQLLQQKINMLAAKIK